MAPARLWLSIFLAGFAVCAALLAATLLTPISYGDLSRVGRISERDFGWRAQPPVIEPRWLRGVPVAQADILVIGDSFSATHGWQSVLARAGYGVASATWASIDEKLCDDFAGWLRRAGFAGRLVIIESVERLLAMRLEASRGCARMHGPLVAQAEPPTPALQQVPGFALNWNGQLVTGWLTDRCTRAAIGARLRSGCDAQVRAMPVPEGCSLFSHRRCEMALFLTEDGFRDELTTAHVTQLQAVAEAGADVPILWMVVPNKTTTYVAPERSQAFAAALARQGLGPDLFDFTQAEKRRMPDFYYPNDTHISTRGQLALGARMLEAVRARIGAPQQTLPPGG